MHVSLSSEKRTNCTELCSKWHAYNLHLYVLKLLIYLFLTLLPHTNRVNFEPCICRPHPSQQANNSSCMLELRVYVRWRHSCSTQTLILPDYWNRYDGKQLSHFSLCERLGGLIRLPVSARSKALECISMTMFVHIALSF